MSDDEGKNWYLPIYFKELETDITPFCKMCWNHDGTSSWSEVIHNNESTECEEPTRCKDYKLPKNKSIKVRMLKGKNTMNKRVCVSGGGKDPRQNILDEIFLSSLNIVAEQSFIYGKLKDFENSSDKEFSMLEVREGLSERIFAEHTIENTTDSHMKMLEAQLQKSFEAFTDAYASPVANSRLEMKGEFILDFSSLNSQEISRKFIYGENAVVSGFFKRHRLSNDACDNLRLLGFLYCIQHDILPVVVNIKGMGAIHHPLCHKHSSTFSNLRWFSVKAEWAEVHAKCTCIRTHPYTLSRST